MLWSLPSDLGRALILNPPQTRGVLVCWGLYLPRPFSVVEAGECVKLTIAAEAIGNGHMTVNSWIKNGARCAARPGATAPASPVVLALGEGLK